MKLLTQPNVNITVQQMAEKLIESLNKRFKGIEENLIFAQATLLDPCFKSYGFSDTRNVEKIKQSLISYCGKSVQLAARASSSVSLSLTAEAEVTDKGSAILDDWDESVSLLVRNPNPKAAAIV